MTITSQDARDEYTATAGQTVFNYTFKIYADTDLDVYITPAGQEANDSADLTTAYTVDPSTIGDPNGGFITLDSGANSGDLVTIVSSMPYDRTVDYQNSGDFLPDTVNGDNDRQVSQIKQVVDLAGRSPKYPNSLQNAVEQTIDLPKPLGFWRDKADGTGVEKVDLTSTGTPTDSSVITYNAGNNFTGGVVRSQENKNADLVSVLDFGAIGDDVTDNITAVNAAIAHCLSSGDQLHWPSGTFFIGSNIANFHDVTHRGGGAVRRGSDTWYIEGKENTARTIYVQSNTGSDTNDGIDSANPLATEQYAIDSLFAIRPLGGETGTLQLVTGHTIQSGILIESGDYSWISIKSDDAEVVVDGFTGYYVEGKHCSAPKWDLFVDGNNELERGYSLTTSQGWIENSRGGRNMTGRAAYANNAFIRMGNTVWNDCQEIYATAGAGIQAGAIQFDGATSLLGALIASRGAVIEAVDATITNAAAFAFYTKRASSAINSHSSGSGTSTSDGCKGVAHADRGSVISIPDHVATNVGAGSSDELILCSRSRLVMNNCQVTAAGSHTGKGAIVTAAGDMGFGNSTLSGAGTDGIDVGSGSTLSAENASVLNSGNFGIVTTELSRAVIRNGTVTGSGVTDLQCTTGSEIQANGCTTSTGAPNVADTNFAAFNTIESNKGIIWN